jgi:hypothetical protein
VFGFAGGNLDFVRSVLSLFLFTGWLARANGENNVTPNGHSLCFDGTFVFSNLGGLRLQRKPNFGRRYDNRGADGTDGLAARDVPTIFVRAIGLTGRSG